MAMTAFPPTITAGPNEGSRVRADRNSTSASRGPNSPRFAASATLNTASTWSSRNADSPVDATSVRGSSMPGSVMINAVGSTMISGAVTPLTCATRWRVSRTSVTGSPESTMASPSLTNIAITSVNDEPSTGDDQPS